MISFGILVMWCSVIIVNWEEWYGEVELHVDNMTYFLCDTGVLVFWG